MISSLIAVGIVKGPGAADTSTTLTAQDLVNISNTIGTRVVEGTTTYDQSMRLQNSTAGGLIVRFGNNEPAFLAWDSIDVSTGEPRIRVRMETDIQGNRRRRISFDLDD
ncbi:MAG: hypothetical protein GY861_14675 [bacterium]|nr:hypothetical protein [bacterium]